MSHRDAHRKVTAQQIAEAVGVDKSAVYQALSGRGRISEAKRGQIIETAERLGYHVDPLAKRLREGRSHVDVPIFSYFLDRGVLVETVARIQSCLTSAGYVAPLHIFARDDERGLSQVEIIRRIRMERPRALVCAESFFDDASLEELRQFQKAGGLVITVGFPSEVRCDQVIFSERENTYMAVRHLLEMGHRRIGYCSPDRLLRRRPAGRRHDAGAGRVRGVPQPQVDVRRWDLRGGRARDARGSSSR